MLYLLLVLFSFVSSLFALSSQELESSLTFLFSDDFGYTLIGEKPASIQQDLSPYLEIYPTKQEELFNYLERTFYKTNNFILKISRLDKQIELINIKCLKKEIHKNKKLEKFVANKFKSEEIFFDQLKNSSLDLFSILDRNPIIIGIVLGYGEENGKFFSRRAQLGAYLRKYPLVATYPFQQKPDPEIIKPLPCYNIAPYATSIPSLDSNFSSLENEWNWIVRIEQKYDSYPQPPHYLTLPVYVARKGKESDRIHKNFLIARDKLAKLFCKKKFNEIIPKIAVE